MATKMQSVEELQPDTVPDTVPMTQVLGDEDDILLEEDGCWAFLTCVQTQVIHRLTKPEYTIGRRDECDFVHQKQTISGKHCTIFLVDDEKQRQVWLSDTSTNGTWIGGTHIVKDKMLLTDTEEIVLVPKTDRHEKISYSISIREKLTRSLSQLDPFERKYHVVQHLGSGAYGEVKLAVNRSNGERVAVKILDKTRFATKGGDSSKLMDEVNIMRNLNHPQVIRVYEAHETGDKLYIILEHMDGGDLFDRISRDGQMSEKDARHMFAQMVEGVEYLHQRSIVHRDLKPENMLLKGPKDTLKISDFGLSRIVGESSFMQTLCGTPQYVAPEILAIQVEGEEAVGYKKEVDIWSLGCILFIMLAGRYPFDEAETRNLYLRSRDKSKSLVSVTNEPWSDEAKDLISRLLVAEPKSRLTIEQIYEHPWMKDTRDAEPPAKRARLK